MITYGVQLRFVRVMRSRHSHIGAILLLTSVFAGCRRQEVDQPARPGADAPSVLLITLDTTRADRLKPYGYEVGETPTLEALAQSGVRFEQAFCQVPLTLPSHVSLLTGTYPTTNGVRINGTHGLGDGVQTLAEVFKKKGYRTGAFVAATVLDSVFGLDRGFDVYEDRMGGGNDPLLTALERPADKLCDAALSWLGAVSEVPFFAWVHFFDAHSPYDPPEPFRGRLADPYDGEIAFVDSQIRRLLDWLEVHELRERTLIVVAGDHGEAFGEHGEAEHGLFVYSTTMHVPLIFSFPSSLPDGQVIRAGVGLIDVFPTVVDLMGWAVPTGLEGVSLLPACKTGRMDFLPVYGESEYSKLAYGWAGLRSLTTARWKYIDAPRPELYDRPNDPAERNNVIDREVAVSSVLRAQLLGMVDQMVPRASEPVSLSADMRKRLESLGYLGVTETPAAGNTATARDPKDMVGVFRAHGRGLLLLRQHRFTEAVALMEPLVREAPESDELYVTLGRAYLEAGRAADAQKAYEASLRIIPDNAYRLWGLGESLRRQNKLSEAEARFQAALALSPDFPAAHCGMGLVLAARREFDRAFEYCRRHVELEPDLPLALTNLANIHGARGQPSKAIPLLQRAIKRDTDNQMAHATLWRAFLATGREPEAIGALRAAREARPTDTLVTAHLAFLLATSPINDLRNPEEALRLAQQCSQVEPVMPEALNALAASYAANGDYQRAVKTGGRALSLAQARRKTALARRIQTRLEVYRSGRPFVR